MSAEASDPSPIDAASDAAPAAAGPRKPPPAVIRWSVLILASLAMFGNYYAYDAIAPLADLLQRLLGYTDTQIGTLNAIYSFPNIIMVCPPFIKTFFCCKNIPIP